MSGVCNLEDPRVAVTGPARLRIERTCGRQALPHFSRSSSGIHEQWGFEHAQSPGRPRKNACARAASSGALSALSFASDASSTRLLVAQ